MESANPAMMQEALRRKKAGAFDITIIVGDRAIKVPLDGEGEESPVGGDVSAEEEADEEAKELDQAPEGTPLGEGEGPGMMEEALEGDPMMDRNTIARRLMNKKKSPALGV